MGKRIYHKPIWLLLQDFADELGENEIFSPQESLNWFRKNYPKIKETSVRAHLVRLTTNNPTRVHYNATNKDDLFFRIDSSHFRKYNAREDPPPIYAESLPSNKPKSHKKVRIRPAIEKRIRDLIANFDHYLGYFEENLKFSGPSIYFHKIVIERIRNSERYELLFDDDLFFDYLYATLASWGMHRMGEKTAKMAEYDKFKASIYFSRERVLGLTSFRLESISEQQAEWIKERLQYLFNSLNIMESGTKLIGNSKALHHLLPDLVPPIDRTHTLQFFYNNTNINRREEEIFLELYDQFRVISSSIDVDNLTYEGFNTSIPKIIDNAIIGFVMEGL